jgi:ReqiPepy6 Gp37-like protein
VIKVFARGPDLSITGQLRFTKLEVELRHLAVSSWSLTAPMSTKFGELLLPGAGIVIAADHWTLSGDAEEIGPQEFSADQADNAYPGTLTVSGGDDLAIVADELAIPDPDNPINTQTAQAYDGRSGHAETVIKGYVGDNVGVGRASWRNDVAGIRLVTVAADLARGGTVSYKARFDPLMDLLRSMSSASGGLGLGVSVVQDGTDLVFDVYEPTDRSGEIVFSRRRRNLRAYSVQLAAPTVTHTVVAGEGEGTARAFRERKDTGQAASWRRVIRTFVDQRQTSDASELDAAGDEELAKGRRSGVLQATAVDTARQRFGQHFGLGDQVGVEIEPGVTYVDQVTAVKITADEKGVAPVQITIGNPDLDPQTPASEVRARRLEAEIAALQRRF